MPRQRIDERHDAASHQGLTAGEAKFTHAAGNKGRAQAVELFQSEDFRLGEKRHVLRHAIDTAEVAAVRHRDAEIRNGAPERIDELVSAADTAQFESFQACFRAVLHAVFQPFLHPVLSGFHTRSDNQCSVPDKALTVQEVRPGPELHVTAHCCRRAAWRRPQPKLASRRRRLPPAVR